MLMLMPSSALARKFAEQGFVVIPGALDGEEVRRLNQAFDDHLATYPQDWARFSESFIQTVDVLPNTDAFDRTIENPRVLPFLVELLGDRITFEEFSMMIRNPVTETAAELKGWHRDIIRDYNRRLEIEAISVVYYLTDVGPDDHCFSIIPGTHGPRVELRPDQVTPGSEVDINGPAGTALVFHARAIHAGKLKPSSRTRRTLHLYYWQAGKPRSSEWTRIPARLGEKHDPALPALLYSKWKETHVLNGTGRKPEGFDPAMPTAELLMEAQRRANAKTAI